MKAKILFSVLLSAILAGTLAMAGPGHRGPGSQFWDDLAADFDHDQDGRITLEELAGAEATFERLDRNADGILTEADFERGRGLHGRMGDRGPRAGRMGGGLLAHLADGDRDGTVTSGELDAFLAELDADRDGLIAEDEVRAALERGGFPGGPRGDRPRRHRPLDFDHDGELEVEDFRALFTELDENGDGVVEGGELPGFGPHMQGPRGGGPLARRADADADGEISSAEWQAFVGRLDADGDGEIGWDEWHAAGPADREPRPERFEMIVRFFDENGNGVLETSDFNAFFAALDADGDGTIEAGERPRHRFRHRHG